MEPSTDSLSLVFAALSDPTRRAMLARLSQGEAHVGELARPFELSGAAISRHLRVLELAGLIERRAVAQRRICRVREGAMREAHEWIELYRQFWDNSLDRLALLLEESGEAPSPVATQGKKTHRSRK